MPRLSACRIGKAVVAAAFLLVIIHFIFNQKTPDEIFPQVRNQEPREPAQIINKRPKEPLKDAVVKERKHIHLDDKKQQKDEIVKKEEHEDFPHGADGDVPDAGGDKKQQKDEIVKKEEHEDVPDDADDNIPDAGGHVPKEVEDTDDNEQELKNWMVTMDKRNAERKANLKKICEETYNKKFKSWDELASNHGRLRPLIVNDEHHFIYSIVYKVGSTNWERVIVEDLGGFKNVHNQKLYSHKALKWFPKFSQSGAKERLGSYTKFMFVRDPLSRILSGYKDKFVDHHNAVFTKLATYIIKEFRTDSNASDPNVTFTEFIRYLVAKEAHRTNVHWKPIHVQNYPCEIEYDIIGKLEEAHEDIPYVLRRVGIFDLTNYGKGPPRKTSYELIAKYYSQLPKDLLHKLYDVYGPDFKLFGYDMPESFTVNDTGN